MLKLRLRQAFLAIGLLGGLSAWTVMGEEPPIVFDNRPERGVPEEAMTQQRRKATAEQEALAAKEYPVNFHTLTAGTIKSVRIRYYNKETWASEKDVRAYVADLLGNKNSGTYGFQIWSQSVGVPEIECFVEFTDEHRKKLFAERKGCRDGRLLIWNTESCYRDATGRWYFVTLFDQFHRAHPKGNRELAKGAKVE